MTAWAPGCSKNSLPRGSPRYFGGAETVADRYGHPGGRASALGARTPQRRGRARFSFSLTHARTHLTDTLAVSSGRTTNLHAYPLRVCASPFRDCTHCMSPGKGRQNESGGGSHNPFP